MQQSKSLDISNKEYKDTNVLLICRLKNIIKMKKIILIYF